MHRAIKILAFSAKRIPEELSLLQTIVSLFKPPRSSFYYEITMQVEEPLAANYLLLLPSGVKLEVVYAIGNSVNCKTIREYSSGSNLENYKPQVCYIITKQWTKH
jgi:hypothetical protein